MSEFGRLLKNSKFASLAKPLKKERINKFPTQQLVETRKAALDRQEWGLKYALPSKVKSRYITFNNVDTQERIVDFETNGSDLWKRLRFQELRLPLSKQETAENPLFYKEKAVQKNVTLQDVLNLDPNASKTEVSSTVSLLQGLRKELKEHLATTKPSKLQEHKLVSNKFNEEALEVLSAYKKKQNFNTLESLKLQGKQKVRAFGGLSYNLKGRLTNEPNGIVTQNYAPGRFLTDRTVAVGGFIAKGAKHPMQYNKVRSLGEPRETVLPFVPDTAVLKQEGEVTIQFKSFAKPTKENFRPRVERVRQQSFGDKAMSSIGLF